MKNLLWRVNELVYRIELYFGVAILTSIVFIVFLQVFNRFVLKQPLSWSEELARILFIMLVFTGISVATKTRAHFGVEFVAEKLSPKMQKIIKVLVGIGIISFVGVIFSNSFLMIKVSMFQKSPALGITVGYLYYILPVFAVSTMLHVLTNMVEDVTGGDGL